MMHQLSFFAYDTLCTINIEAHSNREADRLLEGARKIAIAVETTLNMYDSSSELSQLCANYELGRAYKMSDMLFDFLKVNLELAEMTSGAFDPTVGPLVKLWNFLSDDPKIPDQDLLKDLLQRIGFHHLKLDLKNKTITFDTPNILIDPGASGKGFALDLVVKYLRSCGVTSGTCDFGGNLFTIGAKQGDGEDSHKPWKAAILNPDNRETIIGTVELEDSGISTSSWYEHSFVRNGTVFHHLLDTHTGMPKPLHLKSVSIISTNAFFTDLLSTVFFMLGEKEGKILLEKMAVQYHEMIEYVAVLEDGSITTSSGAGFHSYKERLT